MTDLDDYCDTHSEEFIAELLTVLSIPSISADPAYTSDVARNAECFAELARGVGFTSVEVLPTAGHPAVYAELLTDPELPTVLVYGHHDVQPVDPLDEWTSPPFEPVVRDGAIRGRGAVDDKGQVFMHLKAVEAHLKIRGRLPINLKLIIEGEEENGSVNFEELVEREKERLQSDVIVVSDTAFYSRDTPSLCVGLRGLAIIDINVHGPSIDLHSGVFGGAVANPIDILTRILASLKDPATERVTVPGFYDSVHELSESERADMANLPFDEQLFRREAGNIPVAVGEKGWSVIEQRSVRPTLEINGIWGGYSGEGSKTIIPATAGAKITCRLVPDQDPDAVTAAVVAAAAAVEAPGVTVTTTVSLGAKPVVVATEHPAIQAASRAIEHVFGKAPVFTREGGSIPPVETFQRVLGVPVVLMGFGLPDDQIHAPNEKFDVSQFLGGIKTIAALWDEISTLPRP